jgi:hypothetical protein
MARYQVAMVAHVRGLKDHMSPSLEREAFIDDSKRAARSSITRPHMSKVQKRIALPNLTTTQNARVARLVAGPAVTGRVPCSLSTRRVAVLVASSER